MAEKQDVEWKESWRDGYLKWICGFANAKGGKIYIGKDDEGNVIGLQDPKKLMEDIPNKIQNYLGIVVDVDLYEEDGREYIEIEVPSVSYPVSYKGEYHYRSGSTKQQLVGAALTDFLLRKTGQKWDAVPYDGITVDMLDHESFEIFRREALRTKRLHQEDLNCTNAELLDKLGLILDGKLKRAAILLFYRHPERLFTGAYVKIGKFGDGPDLLYEDTVEGSLMIMADRTVDLIYLKYLKAAISYEKEVRVETYPFAREAIREAVFNALVHSKWQEGNPIQIKIRDMEMRISNSCSFPEGWTKDDLLLPHKSVPYNPDIANVFYKAGYIESWGRGIDKIFAACKELGAEDPEYDIIGGDITICLKAIGLDYSTDKASNKALHSGGDNGGDGGNSGGDGGIFPNGSSDNEQIVYLQVIEDGSLTAKQISDITGITKRTVERTLKKLKDKGVIIRIGSSRSGRWEKR